MADSHHASELGRSAAAELRWGDAYGFFAEADQASVLRVEDVELFATAAYMVGRDPESVSLLERAHQMYLDDGRILEAVRAAFWTGINLVLRGESEAASGWIGRAHRVLGRHDGPTAEAGYLLLPTVIQAAQAGNHSRAFEAAAEAIDIGEQFNEPDLVALAVYEQGRALIRQGRMHDGLRLLDEAMVAVLADNLSPFVTGVIYCGVIEGCHSVHALRRAHRWTEALTAWCSDQAGMVAFTGQCLTHRAELLQMNGDWVAALKEAKGAGERFLDGMNQFPAAQALYRQGELHRLRGELDDAKQAYEAATRWGWPAQPGLALLRLEMGETAAAAATIASSLGQVTHPIDLARLLPAAIRIHLDNQDLPSARKAAEQLSEIASDYDTETLTALATHSIGLVLLAESNAADANAAFGLARNMWAHLDAPYETALARIGVAQACRELGDAETAEMEIRQALAVFERLGAQPDTKRARSLLDIRPPSSSGLTAREIEVLGWVAVGSTNREIAAQLVLSERTVDRHVSNILTKLGVTSRTAATTYAHEHGLLDLNG